MSVDNFSEACMHSQSRLEVTIAQFSARLDAGQATEIVKLLHASAAPPTMKAILTRSVLVKVQSSSGTGALGGVGPVMNGTMKKQRTSPWQKCNSAEHLLPARVWDIIEDPKQLYWT